MLCGSILSVRCYGCWGLILFVSFCGVFANAGQSSDYIQQLDHGSVNWTRGLIHGRGAAEKIPGKRNGIDRQSRRAVEKARDSLLQTIYGLKVDSSKIVEEVLYFDEKGLEENIINMVKRAEVVGKKHSDDGTIEVVLEMSIFDAFSRLVLPMEITRIATIKPVHDEQTPLLEQEESSGSKTVLAEHTGLVVNATGLNLIPAMAPKILDERGEQIYGAAYASRDFAVQYGMCQYVKDYPGIKYNARVGENPLVVQAVRTLEPGFSDIVISNADAKRIRSSSENIGFLKKCRVVIMLD